MDYEEGSIRIEGLTPIECWYLDILWRLQTLEELAIFKSLLSPEDLIVVEKLQMLLIMEVLEQSVSKETEFELVKQMLKRYMKP
jgi:hypothetical protein